MAWAPALSADQELPGPGGGQVLPSPLPPSFFISVTLKGTLVLVYYLWGCQRHLGLGVCGGGSCFHAEKPPIIKEKGPVSVSGLCSCPRLLPRDLAGGRLGLPTLLAALEAQLLPSWLAPACEALAETKTPT